EILRVRPGITDPASITFRDESALLGGLDGAEEAYLKAILPRKLRIARRYAERASLLRDVALIAQTVFVLAYPARSLERAIERLRLVPRLQARPRPVAVRRRARAGGDRLRGAVRFDDLLAGAGGERGGRRLLARPAGARRAAVHGGAGRHAHAAPLASRAAQP